MKRTAKDILKEKGGHMVTISSDATVYQALTVMTQNKVGSIVIVDEEKNRGYLDRTRSHVSGAGRRLRRKERATA